jgi:hypothetical protein
MDEAQAMHLTRVRKGEQTLHREGQLAGTYSRTNREVMVDRSGVHADATLL